MLLSPCLWGAYSHVRKSYFLVKWHHVVLTGQAQLDSGKQVAAGAQPVQWVVTTAASSSLSWRGWGPCRAQLGSCQQHPWDPPVLRHLQREGLQSQQAAPSTLGSLTGLFFFSRVSFHSRSPRTTLEAVPMGTSWVPYPLIEVFTAWRCPLRSFPRAALREGAGETSVFTAPGPLQGMQTRSSSYPGSLESWCLLGEKRGGPVKETGGSDLKTLVSWILVGSVLTEHFTCQWNGDSDWLLGRGEPHQLSSNSQKSIKEIRATPLVSFKSFLIKKKKKQPTNAWLRVSEQYEDTEHLPSVSACGKGNCEKNAISQPVSLTQVFNRRQIFTICSVPGPTDPGMNWSPHCTSHQGGPAPQSTAAGMQCLAHHRLGLLKKCRNIKMCQGRVYWAGFNSYLFFSPYLQLHQISNSQLCFSSGSVTSHTSSTPKRICVLYSVSNTVQIKPWPQSALPPLVFP